MAEIIEKKRRFYSGLDADKASIPGGGIDISDRFLATDSKIDYFWDGVAWIDVQAVLAAKTEASFGRYVPRSAGASDYGIGTPFVLDGDWYVDQLDTTGIVPAGAVAVMFRAQMRATAANIFGEIRRSAGAPHNSLTMITQVANITLPTVYVVMPCDADRLFDCRFYANTDLLEVTVVGWCI